MFLGQGISTAGVVPLARARLRVLQWELAANVKKVEDYDEYITLSEESCSELRFCIDLRDDLVSPILDQLISGTVTMDASEAGLGILFNGHLLSEEIKGDILDCNIYVKELFALKRFLHTLGSRSPQHKMLSGIKGAKYHGRCVL